MRKNVVPRKEPYEFREPVYRGLHGSSTGSSRSSRRISTEFVLSSTSTVVCDRWVKNNNTPIFKNKFCITRRFCFSSCNMVAAVRCNYAMQIIITITIIAFVAAIQGDTVIERMEKRCRRYAESVFEIVDDPILLPGAQPKKRDTCRISSQTVIVGGTKAGPQEFPHMV
uniref:Uncharacterized protein n=1 Tax=Lygus hesperus TaxID=30085 RepID=A0A146M8Y9_LYGHE